MAPKLNPYLCFRDNTQQAMEFYHSVFGGDLSLNRFGDIPGMAGDDEKDKVMHGQLDIPGGLTLMAADTPNHMEFTPAAGFAVSVFGQPEDEDRLRGYFDKLADGGTTQMPMDKAPWGDIFGMCTDRFGISWMIDVAGSS